MCTDHQLAGVDPPAAAADADGADGGPVQVRPHRVDPVPRPLPPHLVHTTVLLQLCYVISTFPYVEINVKQRQEYC